MTIGQQGQDLLQKGPENCACDTDDDDNAIPLFSTLPNVLLATVRKYAIRAVYYNLLK